MASGNKHEKGHDLSYDEMLQRNSLSPHRSSGAWLTQGRCQLVWVLSASISISSSRWILITNHFHFPILLLAWQATVTVLIVALQLYFHRGQSRHDHQRSYANSDNGFSLNLRTLAAAILAAVALPVGNQAILHFQNVSALAMFSIHTLTVLVLFNLSISTSRGKMMNNGRPSSENLTFCALAIVCLWTSYLILANDYRRASRGDRSLIIASYLTASSQIMLTMSPRRESSSRIISHDYFKLAIAGGALLIGTIWYLLFEGPYTSLQFPPLWVLLLNMLSTAAAIYSGGSLLIPLTLPSEEDLKDHNQFLKSLRQKLLSVISAAGLTAVFSLLLPSRGFISAAQMLCFTTTFSLLFLTSSSYHPNSSLGEIFRLKNISRSSSILLLLCWGLIALLNWSDFALTPPQPPQNVRIDQNYQAATSFDIVLAHFDETVDDIVELVSAVTSVPAISKASPNLIIYTKNHTVDVTTFKDNLQNQFKVNPTAHNRFVVPSSSAEFGRTSLQLNIEVQKVPNVGREGATYLHHISSRFDNLARHTMFTQAKMHDVDKILERLRYFLPGPPMATLSDQDAGANNRLSKSDHDRRAIPLPHMQQANLAGLDSVTGMLPLGFEVESCDCHRCSDTWGWYDTSPLIPRMFSKVYGLPERDCKQTLLTYKASFIVSAQRIRGLSHSVYDDYLDALTRDDRWEHSQEYLESFTGHGGVNALDGHGWGEKDSIERPWYGYTLERTWTLLFQCNDLAIAWKCPTLEGRWRSSFSGVQGGADLGDCQCFDTIRSSGNA